MPLEMQDVSGNLPKIATSVNFNLCNSNTGKLHCKFTLQASPILVVAKNLEKEKGNNNRNN